LEKQIKPYEGYFEIKNDKRKSDGLIILIWALPSINIALFFNASKILNIIYTIFFHQFLINYSSLFSFKLKSSVSGY